MNKQLGIYNYWESLNYNDKKEQTKSDECDFLKTYTDATLKEAKELKEKLDLLIELQKK